ncbi:MAG: hypothetical protein HQ526_00795 [Actinobacteria bacterium]|nr:hypothetical protein [Actinomycetota bacterium]
MTIADVALTFLRRSTFRSKAAVFALGAVMAVGLAACSDGESTSDSDVTNLSNNVFFTPCTDQTCQGEIDGSPFRIQMPRVWNGTLMVYSHEARGGAGQAPAEQTADALAVAPDWTLGGKDVQASLLASGYALAGAAATEGGWRVDQQLAAADALYEQFKRNVAVPNRVYTWGPSNGALASVNLAENRDWVNGSFGMCGTLAGLTRNYDVALDAAFAVKQLLYPKMKLANYSSLAQATSNYKEAMKQVRKAAKDKFGEGAIKLAVIGPVGEVPPKTATLAGAGISGQAEAIAAGLKLVLARSTIDRFAVEQEMGGNISSNVGTNYLARFTVAERDKIDEKEPGATAKYLNRIGKGKRVAPDGAARSKANDSPNLSGATRVPTVTLHTQFDPLAILQNEGSLVAAANEQGAEARRLLAPNVVGPPPFYSGDDGAVAGAGHCSFTTESVFGSVTLLDEWVRQGMFPSQSRTTELLGEGSGYIPDYPLLKWPAGPTG